MDDISFDKDDFGSVSPLKKVDETSERSTANEEIEKLNHILAKKNRELQVLINELKTFNLVAARDYKETLQQLYTNLEFIVSKDARHLSEAGKANIRRAQSAIQKMNLLTDDINTYFDLYDLNVGLMPVDPNPIINKVITKWKSKLDQCNAEIEQATLPLMSLDPQLFLQLVTSLIDNSIKFRNVVLPLVIKIKFSKIDGLNSIDGTKTDQPYGILSISDNGNGFHESESEKVFDLFYRAENKTKVKGAGIGLAACKRIMLLLGGFMTAEGAPAIGATFNCYFPM